MNKAKRIFLVDIVLALLFFLTTVTGLLVWFIFPFDLGTDEVSMRLEEIHKWVSLILVAVTAYHFIVHWEWYKKVLKSLRR